MGLMDALQKPELALFLTGLGGALSNAGRGQPFDMSQTTAALMATGQKRQQQEALKGLMQDFDLTPQQRGLMEMYSQHDPNAAMGTLAGVAFPDPSDPYARYKNVGGALWDVGAEGGPSQLSQPAQSGSRYYTVSTSQGMMVVDKYTGETFPMGSQPGGAPGGMPMETQGIPAPGGPYRAPSADPALQGDIVREKEGAKIGVEDQREAPGAIQRAEDSVRVIEEFVSHPGFDKLYGGYDTPLGEVPIPDDWLPNMPSGDAAGAQGFLNQITGKSFIEAFDSLRGGGHITEIEGQKATDAITRLTNTRQSPQEARRAAKELQAIIRRGMDRWRQRGGQEAAPVAPQGAPSGVPDFTTMSTEELEAWLKANGG